MVEEDNSPSATTSARGGEGACAEDPKELREASELLESLYEVHDFFFTDNKGEKREQLKELSEKVVAKLEEFGKGSTNHERARVAFLRGRALDVFEGYNKEAEASLAKAVKLEPSNIGAWNALGHCFWKKKDYGAARDCFQQALVKVNNKDSLRKLSMLLRQLPAKNLADAQKNVQESLRRAKEAIKLDLRDPESWYVLGNAYVTMFFKVTHSPADLQMAINAYNKAEAHGGENHPDLFFNKANVLRFQEDFAEAAEAFKRAADLDPSLPSDEALEGMQLRVRRTVDLLHKKGRLKEKRLAQLISGLASVAPPDDSHGLCAIADLSVGENKAQALALKLVIPVGAQEQPPNSFIMADSKGDCAVLSVYHLDGAASSKFGEKDVFVVLDPVVKRVRYQQQQQQQLSSDSDRASAEGKADGAYNTIQILEPSKLLVNGKPIEGRMLSPAVVRLDAFDS